MQDQTFNAPVFTEYDRIKWNGEIARRTGYGLRRPEELHCRLHRGQWIVMAGSEYVATLDGRSLDVERASDWSSSFQFRDNPPGAQPLEEHRCKGCGRRLSTRVHGDQFNATRWCHRCGGSAQVLIGEIFG